MLKNQLVNAGFDGVVYLNRREGIVSGSVPSWLDTSEMPDAEFASYATESSDSYIAFSACQIKSSLALTVDVDDRQSMC